MDPKSKATIYSDNVCPNCKALIPYSSVYEYFYAHDCHTEFEFTCDNCNQAFDVEVEAIPAFSFSKPANTVLQADMACACPLDEFGLYQMPALADGTCPTCRKPYR